MEGNATWKFWPLRAALTTESEDRLSSSIGLIAYQYVYVLLLLQPGLYNPPWSGSGLRSLLTTSRHTTEQVLIPNLTQLKTTPGILSSSVDTLASQQGCHEDVSLWSCYVESKTSSMGILAVQLSRADASPSIVSQFQDTCTTLLARAQLFDGVFAPPLYPRTRMPCFTTCSSHAAIAHFFVVIDDLRGAPCLQTEKKRAFNGHTHAPWCHVARISCLSVERY